MSVREPLAFLTGPHTERERLTLAAAELQRIGYQQCARWLTAERQADPSATEPDPFAYGGRFAGDDIEDLERADVVVAVGPGGFPQRIPPAPTAQLDLRGERHVEAGYAMALRKRVVIVGGVENTYHEFGPHNGVHVVPTWHEATLLLAGWLIGDLREMPTDEMVQAG